jgi:hypothetical protein
VQELEDRVESVAFSLRRFMKMGTRLARLDWPKRSHQASLASSLFCVRITTKKLAVEWSLCTRVR